MAEPLLAELARVLPVNADDERTVDALMRERSRMARPIPRGNREVAHG